MGSEVKLVIGESKSDFLPSCEHALQLMLTQCGNASAEVERVLADDPENVFAHCLRAALIVRADDHGARAGLAQSCAVIEAARPELKDGARRHAAAARAWLEAGAVLAAERYGKIVRDWPHDLVAIATAHALDFRLGRRRPMRNRLTRVLREWRTTDSGYASVLAMYAFALEESGQYRRAEAAARCALTLEPEHPYAIHVVAHVMEMQGRVREGLDFLAATESVWLKGTGLSVHLAWHRALFQLDSNNPEAALATYDAEIASTQDCDMSALADASALLWRLQLQSIRLGDRWELLADKWQRQALAGARPFYVAHAMMAFATARRSAAAAGLIEALHTSLRHLPEEELAPPFCEAVLAFVRGDYAACIEWLTRVRRIANRCGGSLAQCDLIHLTFTEAALRARRTPLARTLVAERTAQKPSSRLNGLLKQRLWRMPPAIAA